LKGYVVTTAFFVIAIYVDIVSYSSNCNNSNASTSSMALIIYYIGVVLSFLVFAYIFTKKRISDAFNIKNEFICVAITTGIAIILTVAGIPFSVQFIIAMLFTINFSICFTWPIITYFIAGHRRHQLAVNNPQPMIVLLNNPLYLKAYLTYCVKEFAIEQPLFYVEMLEFNRKFDIMTQREQEDTALVIFFKVLYDGFCTTIEYTSEYYG